MSRHLCITSVDGHTGFLVAKLILTDANFKKAITSVTGLSLHPDADSCKELTKAPKSSPTIPASLRIWCQHCREQEQTQCV